MKQIQKNLTDLHKRLHAVLPEYPPISTFAGKSGTFKAINADGNVFLVTWTYRDGEPPLRKEEFAMDYFTLCRKSEDKISSLAPDQGWDISEPMI